jgi:hypothetical protein
MRVDHPTEDYLMRNPIPKRYRHPLNNVVQFVLFFLACTGLHAMIIGRAPVPPTFALFGFAVGSVIAVWVQGAMADEHA